MHTYQEICEAIEFIQLCVIKHMITIYDVDITAVQSAFDTGIIIWRQRSTLNLQIRVGIHRIARPPIIYWTNNRSGDIIYQVCSDDISNDSIYVKELIELCQLIKCCEPIRGSKG